MYNQMKKTKTHYKTANKTRKLAKLVKFIQDKNKNV